MPTASINSFKSEKMKSVSLQTAETRIWTNFWVRTNLKPTRASSLSIELWIKRPLLYSQKQPSLFPGSVITSRTLLKKLMKVALILKKVPKLMISCLSRSKASKRTTRT